MNRLDVESYGCTDLSQEKLETVKGGGWFLIGFVLVAIALILVAGYKAMKAGQEIIRKYKKKIDGAGIVSYTYADYCWQYGYC